MVDLEKITDMLVEDAKKFRGRDSIDLSMFPEEKATEIYELAAMKALEKKDYEAVRTFLYNGKLWNKILELGKSFFHSDEEVKQKYGKHFLETLVFNQQQLPKNIAIELADHILEHDGEHYRYRAARALNSGKAIERAKEVGFQFFEKGNFEDGMAFLEISKKKLSNEEVKKYAEVAFKNGRYSDVFEFYQLKNLDVPKDRAKILINADQMRLFDKVFDYMEKTKNPFTPEDIKEFADQFFEGRSYEKALDLYKKAGDLISGEDYKQMGHQILSLVTEIESSLTAWTPGIVWPTVRIAYSYLSKKSSKEAKKEIARYADTLLEKENFAKISSNVLQFGMLYEMIEMKIPVDKALKAAHMAEEKEKYDEAAKFYVAAGKPEEAKRMGYLALKSDNDWQRRYGSKKCFEVAGDDEDSALSEFVEKNFDRY